MFAGYILLAIPLVVLHTSPLHLSFAMASHGSSTNVTSGPAFPQPISDPPSGGRPSVATDQQSLRADAGILETGFPQFETSSGAIPPLPPPRPTPPPHPPRGVPGLIQRSTGQNTNETYTSFPEEYASTSSQSQRIASMSSPEFLRVPEQPPSIPMQYQQPAPGGGVGGFTLFNSDVPADYAYRFDTIPSPGSDSDHHHYESEDVTGGVHEKVWPIYNRISEERDKKMLKKWNSDLDVLLIFVSVAFGLNP